MYIQSLDLGKQAHRVDWFGNLAYPDRGHRWTQPSICVVLSEVEYGNYDVTSLSVQQCEIWIPIGLLPLLRVGDIWLQGKLLFSASDSDLEIFSGLEINRQSVVTIKAGVSDGAGNFYLPIDAFNAHKRHTHSYCILIQISEQRKIIIPCWELVRFYFGTSGKVLERLVKPNLSKNQLFTNVSYFAPRGHLCIKLAPGIKGFSASDVGRLALSENAWNAALRVSASCLKASISGEPIYPHTSFPFEGNTTLSASGRWIRHGDRENSTFVVNYLRQCSHPFPFKSLRYELDQGELLRKRNTELNSSKVQEKFQVVAKPSVDSRIIDGDPGKSKKPVSRVIGSFLRFPDLDGKEVWRSLDVQSDLVSIEPNQPISTIDHCPESVGDAVSSANTRAIDISLTHVLGDPQNQSPLPVFLKKLFEIHTPAENTTFKLLFFGESSKAYFQVPAMVDEDGVVTPDSWFKTESGKFRMRRACALLMYDPSGMNLIIVVEPAHGCVSDEPLAQLFIWEEDKPITLHQMQQNALWTACLARHYTDVEVFNVFT
ncbi:MULTISPECIES: hypothetical protein [Deefgea]|uniref:Uncharacterized protein n=1 Tax=Deefgea chitinilytica TaxID=570276 RepID=A0ABS2CFR3_9NEIS|nr:MULTISPECIES: hypothetical protein [Deefgea]MBM5573004.1 hypothetical protein [Deefgea chitinilytica]MBM9890240.1 hypothetical protein [Deefgea sp. CFH1-16]